MASESPSSERKVVIHLRATGDAPILKQAKFKIAGTDKFVKVIDFLRRQLNRDTLFVYVNSAFSPNPDELVIDLYDNFGFDGKLVLYCWLANKITKGVHFSLPLGMCKTTMMSKDLLKAMLPLWKYTIVALQA
ncbi:hypothetical protein NE237_026033 [Protea cynaroides]|uniref:Ubiquitin-like protein ATG12 n=1 Tax=Protea cynaroides TaxID=273540 RepID=A0A9Q0K131_9MAGN|nr:hypothetical protein NE237_026033 [Protea cynaroides]